MAKNRPKIFSKLNIIIGFIASVLTILAWVFGLFSAKSSNDNRIDERLVYSVDYQSSINAVNILFNYFRVTLVNNTSKEIVNLNGHLKKRYYINRFESVTITSTFKISDSLQLNNDNSEANIYITSLNPGESIVIHVVSMWIPFGLSGSYENQYPFEEVYFRAPGITAYSR